MLFAFNCTVCVHVTLKRFIKRQNPDKHITDLRWQCSSAVTMANVYSFDGLLVFALLFICTCAYLKKVPRVKGWLLSEKRGVWGVFYKASVIGNRLHLAVALSCVTMAFYVLFLK